MDRVTNKAERIEPPRVSLHDDLFELAKDLARKEDDARNDARAATHAIIFNQAATIERLRYIIKTLRAQS